MQRFTILAALVAASRQTRDDVTPQKAAGTGDGQLHDVDPGRGALRLRKKKVSPKRVPRELRAPRRAPESGPRHVC